MRFQLQRRLYIEVNNREGERTCHMRTWNIDDRIIQVQYACFDDPNGRCGVLRKTVTWRKRVLKLIRCLHPGVTRPTAQTVQVRLSHPLKTPEGKIVTRCCPIAHDVPTIK